MSEADAARLAWIREDVHIHASGADVYARLVDLGRAGEWLAPTFRALTVTGEDAFSFSLALPLRTEQARLRRDRSETEALTFVGRDGGALRALTWAFHQEGPRDVHLTVEARYEPAGGVLGSLLEPLLHRPHRTQALRDTLWKLKQLSERGL